MISKGESEETGSEKEGDGHHIKGDMRKLGWASSAKGKHHGFTYTSEELLELRDSPLTRKKPACLAAEFCDDKGIWDPELWHNASSGKKSRGPSPLHFQEGGGQLRRKFSDAKERIKEEKDGIVLSPQRRSFGHGCHVSGSGGVTGPPAHSVERDSQNTPAQRGVQGRRIGSGRIITRTSRPTTDVDEREQGQRRIEREPWDHDRERDQYRRHGGGYDRRNRYNRHEVEPEWFTGGPTSQSDTIELHGFQNESEDSDSEDDAKQDTMGPSLADRNGSMETAHSSSPDFSHEGSGGSVGGGGGATLGIPGGIAPGGFDINDFFKFADTMAMVPSPEEAESCAPGKSRFQAWFQTPTAKSSHSNSIANSRSTSRKSSIHDDELDFLHELTERASPRMDPAVFSPNSAFKPVIRGDHSHDRSHHGSPSLLQLLQKGKTTTGFPGPGNNKVASGHVKSVAELEAEMKEMSVGTPPPVETVHVPQNVNHKHHQHPHADHRGPVHHPMMQHMHKQQSQEAFNMFVANMRANGNLPEKAKVVTKQDGRPMSPIEIRHAIMLEQERAMRVSPPLHPPPPQIITPTPPPQTPQIVTPTPQMPPRIVTPTTPQPQPPQLSHSTPRDAILSALRSGDSGPGMVGGKPQQPVQLSVPQGSLLGPHQQHQQQQQQQQPRQTPSQLTLTVPPVPNRVPSPINQEVMSVMMNPGLQQQEPTTPTNLKPPHSNQEILNALVKQAAGNPGMAAALMSQAGRDMARSPKPQMGDNRPSPPQGLLPQPPSTPRGASPLPGLMGHQSPFAPSPIPPGGLTPTNNPVRLTPSPLLSPMTAGQASPAHARIPSPAELATHTQKILQQALIKKQLEVQREKFMAKEARSKSPIPAHHARSPIPQQQPSPMPMQPQQQQLQQLQQQQMHQQQMQHQLQHLQQQQQQLPVSPAFNTRSGAPTTPKQAPPRQLSAAFTPTSVIRRMHESKVEAKLARGESLEDKDMPHDFSGSPKRVQVPKYDMATTVPAPPTVTVTTPPRGTPDIDINALSGSTTMSTKEEKLLGPAKPPEIAIASEPSRSIGGAQHIGVVKPEVMDGHLVHIQPEPHPGLGAGQNLKVGNPQQDKHTPNFDRHTPNNLAAPRNVDRQVSSPVPMPSPRHIPRPMGPSFISPIPRAPPPAVGPAAAYSQAAVQANLLRSGMFPGSNPTLRGVPPFQQMQVPPQSTRHPAPVTSMPMLLNPAYNPIQAAAAAMAAGMHRPQIDMTPRTPQAQLFQQNTFNPMGVFGGESEARRHSPVNQLAKWFGADVLKQPLHQMPPMLPQGQRVMSVEELERQQQAVN